jgi:hypothetical protein
MPSCGFHYRQRAARHGPRRVVRDRGRMPVGRRPAVQIHYTGPAGTAEAQAWHSGKTSRGARSNDATVPR